ncbi:acetate--CoA ligase family protein [Novosphingobium acidiphilum]|uniref:acetate--CoA ligase family protein n=1 Tax=Novosphingobium acidiphilum TaxID=505248 RepID=UPI00041918E3|nr:acetate--CoA ligase family protein [Novosphingobium acidiphilum]
MSEGTPRFSRKALARLLRPGSVAVVGASDKPGALGATLITNLDRAGFAGAIYPINPRRDAIGARRCLASIEDLPHGVDVAVLAIPRPAVIDTVRALATRGVGAAIVFSAGFAEDGPEGLAEQAEIARIANAAGMVIEGPNCLGLVNHVDKIPLTFVEAFCEPPAGRRAVGVVSQSGAMAAVVGTVLIARAIPTSYSVSTGNEAVSGVEDYVDWLIDDPDTQVIAMIVESFRKPARFLAAAQRARAAGKPMVLLHPGTSVAARESAATHTGAMAGDYQLMRAKVARTGVIFAETLQELGDVAELLVRCPALARPEVAVLGESGAFKAMVLDQAERLGLPLTALDNGNAPALRAALPAFVPVSNPLDLTAQGLSQPSLYTDVLTALFDDDRVGAVVAGIIQSDPATADIKVPAILAALDARTVTKPVVFAGLDEGARMPDHYIAALRARGVPWFPTTERVLAALARLGADRRPADTAPISPLPLPALADEAGVIPEYRSKALLASIGVPFPERGFAADADTAVSVADALGYPVAMKAQASALSHKSDAGGVILNLADGAAVRAAWTRMHASVAAYDATIALDGVLIEAMGPRGMEMIVGGRNDPEWGAVVLAGFGGVTAEVLHDVRLFTPDMTEAEVIADLGKLKSAALLAGWRGAPALDVPALARLIVTVARLLHTEPRLAELDLNPVILYPRDQGVIALDALILAG